MVALKHNTEREYRDLDAFGRVNNAMDKDYFQFFIPDLYKTGLTYSKHSADVKVERTQQKVENRRLRAVALGLGNKILLGHEVQIVQAIVDGLMPRVMQLMDSNMAYIGITRFEEDGDGFNREVVRSFAVDGGCTPSLVVRDGSVVLKCGRIGVRCNKSEQQTSVERASELSERAGRQVDGSGLFNAVALVF